MAPKAGKLLPLDERLALQAEVLHLRHSIGQTQDYIAARIRRSQAAIVKAEKGEIGPDLRNAFLGDWDVTIETLQKKYAGTIARIRHHQNPERALKELMGPAGKKPGGAHDPLEGIFVAHEAADALAELDGVDLHIARSVALAVLREPGQAVSAIAVYRRARHHLRLVDAKSSKPTA